MTKLWLILLLLIFGCSRKTHLAGDKPKKILHYSWKCEPTVTKLTDSNLFNKVILLG
jgi:hypothetical protein